MPPDESYNEFWNLGKRIGDGCSKMIPDRSNVIDKRKVKLDVNRALRDAGDLAPDGCEGMDQAVSEEGDGGWESRSMGMVAENLIRLSEKAWQSRR